MCMSLVKPWVIAPIFIAVTDTGIGIAEDKLSMVFEKFTQAESSTTRQYGGTGLGLAISRGLAESMGGTLTASSTLGVGTTFTLQIPLEPITPRLAKIETDSEQIVDASPKKVTAISNLKTKRPKDRIFNVLIVDDDEINRIIVSGYLKHPRVNISFAENGLLAVKACKTVNYDMVFMDISMPVMDGTEATKIIRQHERERGCEPAPIICLTANTSLEDRKTFFNAGMDDYLSKPLQSDKLYALVSKWFAKIRRLEEDGDKADIMRRSA